METINVIQGSPEWAAHRANHFNASDAPAMMGVSKYKSRNELLQELASGILPEHDADTHQRFADGHAAEALARPLAEEIIGSELYPVTGVLGKYSASFDGLPITEDVPFEHKALNDEIRACQNASDLHLMYRIQMEQQLMVCGGEKCLFMASKWKDETLVEEKHFWYVPDMILRADILKGWAQFKADLKTYTPPEVIPAAVAAPVMALPALSIQVEGAIKLVDNLALFGEGLKAFVARIPEKPSTDQEFADCKAAIKTLQDAQDKLDAAEASALGQIASFDEMKRTKALLFDLARDTRLAVEKLVTAREKTIKEEKVAAGRSAFDAHIAELNKVIGKPYMPVIPTDFAGVIKGKRTVVSLQNAVDTELARAKIAANEVFARIQANMNSLRELAKDHAFLFADTTQIVLKANEDLVLMVNSRIAEHKRAEEERLAREREAIRIEEEIKATAKAATAVHQPVTNTPAVASAVLSTPIPPAERITKITPQNVNTGMERLRLLISEVLADMTAGELQQVLDSARAVKAAREKVKTA